MLFKVVHSSCVVSKLLFATLVTIRESAERTDERAGGEPACQSEKSVESMLLLSSPFAITSVSKLALYGISCKPCVSPSTAAWQAGHCGLLPGGPFLSVPDAERAYTCLVAS